jgi:hypothetical protein
LSAVHLLDAAIAAETAHKTVACRRKSAYFQLGGKRAEDEAAAMHIGTLNQLVLVKRYAERRLYRGDTARYVTREDLISMARRGEGFVVVDAKTGADVTSSFRPIMVEH